MPAAEEPNAIAAARPFALIPCLWLVSCHITSKQTRRGFRVPSKIVAAVGDVYRWHLAQQ